MPKSLLPLSLSLSLFAAVAPAHAAPATPPPSPAKGAPDPAVGNALFRQAIEQTQAGKPAAAEATYHKLLKLFPKAAPAWANLGLLAARANRLDEAAADLGKATALEPKTAPFWAQLSSIELRRGNAKSAEAAARKTLALDPANLFGLGNLAGALMQQGRYADAVAPLTKLRTTPGANSTQAAFSLVVALARSGQKAAALQLAGKLAQQNPDQPNFHLMLGDLAAQTGDYATARTAYAAVYRLLPTDTRAGINSAVAAELSGDVKGAKNQIEKIIAAHPQDALAHFQLGRLYYAYPGLAGKTPGNFAMAADSFDKAVLLDPKNPLYLSNDALACLFEGPDHFDEAEKLFLSALSVAPNDTVAHMGLGYLYEKQDKPADAIAQYRAILDYAPRQYDARRRLAGLLYATGKHDEAYREFQTLAEETPGAKGNVPLEEMASLQLNEHRYEDALKAYAQAVARDPQDAPALVGQGQALEALKQPDAAKQKYETALTVSPKNATAYVALGTLLENEGKKDEATKVYERFAENDPTNNTAHWQLAQFYKDQHRDDDALREMHKLTIQRSDPTHLTYLLGPTTLLMQRGRYADAVKELQPLIAQNPGDSTELRYILATAQEQAGNPADAEKTLLQLSAEAKMPAAQSRSGTALAQFYERTSRWDDAAHYFEDTLHLDPASIPAREGLWQVRSKQGKPSMATDYLESLAFTGVLGPNLAAVSSVNAVYLLHGTREQYRAFTKRVAERYPKSREALNLYADALLDNATGSPREHEARTQAADLYRQITVLDPRDADAFYKLGVQEEGLGRKDQAVTAYQSAIRVAAGSSDTTVDSARKALKRLGAPEVAAASAPTPANPAPAAPAPASQTAAPGTPSPPQTSPAPTQPVAPKEGNGPAPGVPGGER